MQVSFDKFTPFDLARYPFLKGTAELIRDSDLRVETLLSPDNASILKRAEARVKEAIISLRIRDPNEPIRNLNVEISSYPVALLLVAATENSFIRKRYALAEAKQARVTLDDEPSEKVLRIAENFEWRITFFAKHGSEIPSDFALHFTDYLRNTTQLSASPEWKLVNRVMIDGRVYLSKQDIVRLLEEEIRKSIENRLVSTDLVELPSGIIEIVNTLKKLASEKAGTFENEGFPMTVLPEAYPPCIKALYDAASKSRHLSHMGRFTLTSFLLTVGMSPEQLTDLFRSFSDFNERLTRYQVEHIAGSRGTGTRYTPPNCETLQTHNLCVNRDEFCPGARNPLVYYKRKQSRVSHEVAAEK